jgi:hypothetical protein
VSGPAAGYTAVLCTAERCSTDDLRDTAAALRECVRTSEHGLLVMAGCTVGALGCRLRPPGPLLVVQPCDPDRQPVGPAVRVGPVTGPEDVRTIERWMGGQQLDPALLPDHLVGLERSTRRAARN